MPRPSFGHLFEIRFEYQSDDPFSWNLTIYIGLFRKILRVVFGKNCIFIRTILDLRVAFHKSDYTMFFRSVQ